MAMTNDVSSDNGSRSAVADQEIENREPAERSEHSSADPAIGAGLGLVGGAIIGGVAGGPLGAVIGGVVGAVASDAAVVGVEHLDRAHSARGTDTTEFDNSGAGTRDYDATTGVTRGDVTIGDVTATDHTVFGSDRGQMVDDSVGIGRTGASERHNRLLEDGTDGPTYP